MSLSFLNKGTTNFTSAGGEEHKMENMRDVSIQERYIREYLKDYDLEEDLMSQVLDLNTRYNKEVEKVEEVRRNVKWNIKEMEFSNLFNYGQGNRLDFNNLSGIVGIFGKNYSGSTSAIESALSTARFQNTYSLDQSVSLEGEGRTFAEIIPDEEALDPIKALDSEKTVEKIKECLFKLSPREEKILRLRFGIAEDLVSDSSFEQLEVK